MITILHTVVLEGSNEYNDFEQHMSDAKNVDNIIINETATIKHVDYSEFKSNIDGTNIKWNDVYYLDAYSYKNKKKAYELYLYLR